MAPLLRLGDPSAPRVGSVPGARIWVAVVLAALVILVGFMLASAIARGDVDRIVGTSIGIALAAVIVVGLFIFFARYWRSGRLAFTELARHRSDAVVIAARLPAVPVTTVEQTWVRRSERLSAQEGVLVADHRGLSLFSVRAGVPELLLDIPWNQVRELTPVEFVESKIAYQGLLLTGVDTGSRLVFQPSLPARLFPTFPTGDRLQDLRDRILRQQYPGTKDEAW